MRSLIRLPRNRGLCCWWWTPCSFSHIFEPSVTRTAVFQQQVFLHSQHPFRLQQEVVVAAAPKRKVEGKEEDEEEEEEEEEKDGGNKNNPVSATSLLLERIHIPRNQSILPALLGWIKAGKELERRQVKAVFIRLEWQSKFSQALEVCKWLLKEKPFELQESHYARWIYYVGKVSGPDNAEEAFSCIPTKFQRIVTYSRLFDIYLEHHKADEAKGIMKRMKDKGIPVPTYICNNLIAFFDKNSLQSRVPTLLKEMNDEKIAFSVHTYNILLACRSRNLDMEGLEDVWSLMKADPLVKPDYVTHSTLASAYLLVGLHEKAQLAVWEAEKHLSEHVAEVKNLMSLILLYGSLGKGDDVERLYQRVKNMPGQIAIPVYVYTIEAYGEAGLVDHAEHVVKEMETQRGWLHLLQFNSLLGVYCKNGMMENAEQVLKKMLESRHKPNALTYSHFLLGYLKTNESENAMKNFELLLMVVRRNAFNWETLVSRAWLQSAKGIIGLFARKGDAKHARLLLNELQDAKLQKFPRAYDYIRKTYEESFGMSLH